MDTQCACTENTFNLSSGSFVVGQVYWLVIDGCGGNVCDYTVDVVAGSTVPFPPANPGPITGPTTVCQGTSGTYTITPPTGATQYTWTLNPPLGTVTGTTNTVNVAWGNTSGTADLCVTVANQCEANPTPSCTTVTVSAVPTAIMSGGGPICQQGQQDPVAISIAFTGDAPWTFTYNTPGGPVGPITTSDNPYNFTVTAVGNYSLQNLNSNGCPGTVSGTATVTQVVLTVSGGATTATCSQSNGQVNVTGVSGGQAPYMFLWSNGAMTEDLTNVPPGNYSVTVTDDRGCQGSATFVVADTPNAPTVSATTTNSECGLENGSINVSASGGAAPYTFLWGGGQTTEDLNNIPAGTYNVTVTGTDGCTTELSVTLGNTDPPINITANIVANTTCNGGNGSITTTVSPQPAPGGGTYTYNWSNGETTPNLSNLIPGTYTITVTTGNSCEGVASFTIPDQPNEPNITFVATPSTCGLENGGINISVSGGEQPYTFNWSNGATTEDIDDVPQGSYSVTVTGANGCTDEATINLSNLNPPITVTANIQPNQGCGPGNWSGSITINIQPNPSPGGGPYSINWNTGETTTTISDLQPGSYSVTVNGGGTCETIQTFTVPDQPNLPVLNIAIDAAECGLSTGGATVTISGGVQPYDIQWSNGASGSSITDVPAGSYGVTVTSANGCSATATANIPDQPITFNVTANVTPNSACDPALNDGAITITVIPNTNNYTITWSNGATGNTITDLANGSYSVTVSAGGTCESVFNYAVPFVPILPGINILTDNPTCGLSNGIVFTQSTGQGVQPFTYQWSNGETLPSISDVPAGTYTVTVTGGNGCSTVASGTLVDEDVPINISTDVDGNTSCILPGGGNGSINLTISTAPGYTPVVTWSNGASGTSLSNLDPGTYTVTVNVGGTCEEILPITLPDLSEIPSLSIEQTPATCGLPDGEADLTVNGGVQPFSYFWSNGNTTEDLFGVPTGSYSVTVTTATGCVVETTVNISENTLLFNVTPAIVQNTSCGFPNGYIDLFVSPPGNYTFLWDNGSMDNFLYDVGEGSYTVTVTAAGDCSQVLTYNVIDLTFPPDATATPIAATCGQSNGGVNLTVVGNSAPYQYQWSNGALTEDLSNVPPGTYTVLITDNNLCVTTAQATVANNNVAINISGTPSANTSCSGTNGAVNISVSPAGNYTYLWSNSATTEDIMNLPAGSYTVTVSSGGNCTSTASFAVTNQVEDPDISQNTTAAICGEANGAIDLTVTGGVAPYTFVWSNGSLVEDQNGLLPGPYSVTVTGANNCTAELTVNVANNSSSFGLSGNASPLTSCATNNGAVDLTITPAGTYTILWSNGATTEDLANLPPGTYEVVVTESGSCSATAVFVVADETASPVISQNISPEICGQENGRFDITVTGGTTPYSFLWSNGSISEDLSNVPSEIYTVTVTDANGCSATLTAEVPENTISFSIQGTPSANTSCDIINGAINLTVNPPGNYTFLWSNGATTEDLSGLAGGTYNVIVSAGGDCTASANITVPSTTEDPIISQTITPATCGEANGSINLNVSGGQAPYTFLWSNTSTTEDLQNLLPDAYTVQVTGANGCVATANFTVPNNSIPINLTGTQAPNTSCLQPNGTITITATPASATYTYLWSNGQTVEDLTNLPPGSYSVTVFEGATCEATANFTVGNNVQLPVLSDAVTASICGQPDGAINVTVTGGMSPFSFLWSNGEMTEDLTDLLSGNYEITVTDALGCSATDTYNVPNNSNTFSIGGNSSPNNLCGNANGAIDLILTPAGLYNFLWSNGETTEDLTALPAGDYSVTVIDGGTCSASATFTVGNNAPSVNVNGAPTDVLCFGENTGAIAVTPNGGVAPYTFDWSPSIPGNPEAPTGLASGDYSVIVTDASGCTGSASFSVGQPNDALQIACAQTAPVSLPGLSDGAAVVNITGGTAPYTVNWNPGGSQANVPGGNFSLNNLGSGAYNVVVIDANGCETPCIFNIILNDCITAVGTMSGNLLSACGEGCLTAAYNSTGQILEPDDLLEYVLHAGSINVIVGELARSTEPTFCFDAASMTLGTTYYISAIAGNDDGTGHVDLSDDCTRVSFGTPIVFREVPVAAIESPNQIDCDNPQVPLVGASSLPGSTFAWSTTNGVILGNADNATIQAGDGGDYQLIVMANGCADTAFVTVTQSTASLIASITADPTEILDCTIDAINLIGSVTGAVTANYVWTYNGQVISTNSSVTVDEGGVYTLTVTDPSNGCEDVAQITIDNNTDFPPLFIDTPPVLNCIQTMGTLSGGSPINGVDFFWATINGTDTVIIGNGPNVDVGTPGTYFLIGVASNSCVNAVSVQVTGDVNPPSANAGDDQSLDCYQTPIQLTGSSTTANVAFNWTVNDPSVVISNPNAPAITVDQPGVYTLTVTQLDNNCQAIDQVVVDLYENVPQADLDITSPDCFGDTNGSLLVEADPANGPYSYSLDGNSNGNNNFFAPLAPGSYELVVTDGQGCTWATLVTLPEPAPVIVELGSDIIVELGETVTLQVLYTVPASQLDTIVWTPSDLLPCLAMPCDIMEIFPVQQTEIGVTVIDTNGCEGHDVLTLFVRKDRDVFIPNAFSPNGDGTNDVFMVYSGKDVVNVKDFLVFSRWGETVFEYHDFVPNNPAFGWDGKHRGEILNPGVFAWFAVIEFADGQEVLFEGDVTLVR